MFVAASKSKAVLKKKQEQMKRNIRDNEYMKEFRENNGNIIIKSWPINDTNVPKSLGLYKPECYWNKAESHLTVADLCGKLIQYLNILLNCKCESLGHRKETFEEEKEDHSHIYEEFKLKIESLESSSIIKSKAAFEALGLPIPWTVNELVFEHIVKECSQLKNTYSFKFEENDEGVIENLQKTYGCLAKLYGVIRQMHIRIHLNQWCVNSAEKLRSAVKRSLDILEERVEYSPPPLPIL